MNPKNEKKKKMKKRRGAKYPFYFTFHVAESIEGKRERVNEMRNGRMMERKEKREREKEREREVE